VRSKFRHGPLHVPSSEDGMGRDTFGVRLNPCQDCYITSVAVELEYPDGSVANANTGMWLHHTAIMNPARTDITCTEKREKHRDERVWAAGNERTFLDLTLGG
jgi:hypothetical protein